MRRQRTSEECFASFRKKLAEKEARAARALMLRERARALRLVAEQLEEEPLPRELREVARKVIDKLRKQAASLRA